MIHQVNISDENIEYLRQIIELQLFLLRIAVRESVITNTIVENELTSVYGDAAVGTKAATWITGKTTTLFKWLNEFAAQSNTKKKQEFVDSVEADIVLLFNQDSGALQAKFISEWEIAAGNFLRHFYELLNSGFPDYLFKNKLGYSRQDFIGNFVHKNSSLFLCAVCDTVAYRALTDEHAYTSIDHFFPKSLYPHFAIHPYNLVPICSLCNSWFKRNDDPMAGVSDITMLILPYSEQKGLSEQAFLQFQERQDVTTRNIHPLELEFKSAVGFPSHALITRFDKIYRIQSRWNNDLEQLDQHVFRRITQFLLGDVQSGYKPEDAKWLADRLRILMGLVFTENLGRDPFAFATTWLLHYHIMCLENSKSGEQAPIHKSLINWATEHQKHIEQMREKAQELIRRVPS